MRLQVQPMTHLRMLFIRVLDCRGSKVAERTPHVVLSMEKQPF